MPTRSPTGRCWRMFAMMTLNHSPIESRFRGSEVPRRRGHGDGRDGGDGGHGTRFNSETRRHGGRGATYVGPVLVATIRRSSRSPAAYAAASACRPSIKIVNLKPLRPPG